MGNYDALAVEFYLPMDCQVGLQVPLCHAKLCKNLFSETTESLSSYVSYNLNCLRWGYVREYIGTKIRVVKGDTRSLDLKHYTLNPRPDIIDAMKGN